MSQSSAVRNLAMKVINDSGGRSLYLLVTRLGIPLVLIWYVSLYSARQKQCSTIGYCAFIPRIYNAPAPSNRTVTATATAT
ncbi:hypothetical protein BDW68DRAFT_170404 [Aspergillus falconensis]